MKIDRKDISAELECEYCPEEWFFYFGPTECANRIAYMRLRSGTLELYPCTWSTIQFEHPIYRHKFWKSLRPDKWKGQFDDYKEREKYINKCIGKIIRWYNKEHKTVKEPI